MASSPDLTRTGANVVANDAPAAIDGVRLASGASGLRYRGRDDVALIELDPAARACCLFTNNRFCAAPVTVARRHLDAARPRYLIVNAGNANAGTGVQGERDATRVCDVVAKHAGCESAEVLPFSTGIIGARLNTAPIESLVPGLLESVQIDGWARAAAAILTTDTGPKLRSARVECGNRTYSVTGIAKGSGMIKPDMATMLAYVATDAPLSQHMLGSLARDAADMSFNCITVDGDTSTNDAFALIATGAPGDVPIESTGDERYAGIADAVTLVCRDLANDIVRDGEGATKFVTVTVTGGRTRRDCTDTAYAVAESPLVKTALFASDPNWGRILAAVGRSGVADLDIADVAIAVGGIDIVKNGEPVPDFDESLVAQAMKATDIDIDIAIGSGHESAVIWTCDLSYDYVKINAEYRS